MPAMPPKHSVAAKAEYGTGRVNGTWLLELALNMKTPTVYDPDPDDPDKRVVNPEATLAAREKQKLIKEKFRQPGYSPIPNAPNASFARTTTYITRFAPGCSTARISISPA